MVAERKRSRYRPERDQGEEAEANLGDELEDTGDISEEPLVFGEADDVPPSDSGPTYVGEMPGDQPGMPSDGKTEVFSYDAPAEPALPLLTVETAESVSEVEVQHSPFVIGRAPECDLVVADQLVSRKHAIIEQVGDIWVVSDQKSGNGTYVNDESVERVQIFDGDVIGIGDMLVTFSLPSASQPAGPAQAYAYGTETVTHGSPLAGTVAGGLFSNPRRKRLFLIGSAIVLVIVTLGVVKQLTKPPAVQGPPPEVQREMERQRQLLEDAKRNFLQVKVLINNGKWFEAQPLIRRVAEVMPDDRLVREYLINIEREAMALQAIEKSKVLIAKNDFTGAMTLLTKIPKDSAHQKMVEQIKEDLESKRRVTSIVRVRQLLEENQFDEALELLRSVLMAHPGDEEAIEMQEKTLALKRAAERPKKTRSKKKKKVRQAQPVKVATTLLTGDALSLLRKGDVQKALAAAKSAEDISAEGKKVLATFEVAFNMGMKLASQAGQFNQAEKKLKQAQQLYRRLAGNEGELLGKIKQRLAVANYIRGNDSMQRGKYEVAFASFRSALKYNPGLDKAREMLTRLETQAKELYLRAYVIKAQAPSKAIKNCQQVLGMVPPSNEYYGKCKKLLKTIGGAGESSVNQDDGF